MQLSKPLGNGVYDFPPSSLPNWSSLVFVCYANHSGQTGKSSPLSISTIPPFTVNATVFPAVVSPSTPATITIYNYGNNSVECLPKELDIGSDGNIVNTISLRSVFIPV